MAKKKQPVVVTITKHKPRGYNDNQVWKVRIEGGKSDIDIPQRFTRKFTAQIGALRKIAKLEGSKPQRSPVTRDWFVPYRDGSVRWVEFVVKPKTTKSK